MNVLITGASAGFGKALAEKLVAQGHRVIGCARRLDKLNEMAETLGELFLPVVMDVSDTQSIAPIIADLPKDFSQIDVLVNNADSLSVLSLRKMPSSMTGCKWSIPMSKA